VLAAIPAGTSFFYTLLSVVLVGLLVLSALFSGAEAGFFSLSPDDLDRYRKSRFPADRLTARLLEKPKRLLATILVTNCFVNISIVVLSAYLVLSLAGPDWANSWLFALVTLLVSFAIVFFGDVLPKVYATEKKHPFLRSVSYLLAAANVLFRPLSWLLVHTTSSVEKYIQKRGYKITVDELNQALELSTGANTTASEQEILSGIVNFGTIAARQIMQPRVDVTAVSADLTFHELMDRINKSGYSRIPVYEDSIDQIEGILYIKDLLPHLDENEAFAWQKLIRPPYFIPENKKIGDLLRDFQSRRVHMAVVVDEYGGTSGVVTLEDIIEEIVGDIQDEFDEESKSIMQLDEHTYVFEGKISLNDFCRALDVDSEAFDEVRGDSESLGGLLLEMFSRLPTVGEKTSFGGFTFSIMSVDNKKIRRVKVILQPEETSEKPVNPPRKGSAS
jgi:gliding motility-associated protein GldE